MSTIVLESAFRVHWRRRFTKAGRAMVVVTIAELRMRRLIERLQGGAQ